MVWSLFYSSLVAIANGIKDGTIRNPHFLPPKLRQRVLDTVIQRRLINDPKCMALLSSAQFLNGMESLSTEPGGYKLEFLERLETSMATMLPNGKFVGAAITKLNLSVDGCEDTSDVTEASSYPFVARLISQCPNTTSLTLCGIKSTYVVGGQYLVCPTGTVPSFPSVLNKDDVCNSVMENLVDLFLRDLKELLRSSRPIVNFKQLTTLKLDNCSLQFDIWPKFLSNVPTLQNLHMIDVKFVGIDYDDDDDVGFFPDHVDPYGLDCLLPVAMPHLQLLEIDTIKIFEHVFECNNAFVDNLMGCKELRQVHLILDQNSTDEESLVQLAAMNIDLRVKARFSDYNLHRYERRVYTIDAALDASSRFKIVRIFHERMDSFELYVWRKWIPEYTTALKDAIDSCLNLTTFALLIPNKICPSDATEIEPDEIKLIKAAMFHFFGSQERAMQLKDLRLIGNFDESVILAVFQCCFNLNRLEIASCPALRDQHLIDWVSNGGGKLKYLHLFCGNVTSEGIIPILAMSSEGLLYIRIHPDEANGEGRNWKAMLSNLCPYAEIE